MDDYTLSQIFAYAVAPLKVGGYFIQAFFPDARKIRYVKVPTMAGISLSYKVLDKAIGAWQYGIGAARSAIRATKWGAKNRGLVAGFAITALGGITAKQYQNWEDLLPLMAITLGTGSDYTSQGRYQRLLILAALIPATGYAYLKGNKAAGHTEAACALLTCAAIYNHDIRNAGGPGATFIQNFKAYLHGIFHGSATGARKAAQVSTDAGAEDIEILHRKLLQEKPNPHFSPRKHSTPPDAHIV